MSELIEDLMMLADKCSEDDPADELGLLLVRAVGRIRADDAALAAKDARIAELEQKVIGLEDYVASIPDYRHLCKELRDKLAGQQQAEPEDPCSVCGNEVRGQGGYLSCECPAPKPATPSEDGGEVPEVVEFHWPEYHAEGMGCGLEDRGIRDRYEAMQHGWDCALDRCAEAIPDEPLMTVAQCKRIVAAKDELISHLRAARNAYGQNAIDLQCIVAAKDAEIAELKSGVKMLEESCRAQSEELRTRDADIFNLQYDANCASLKIRQLEQLRAQPARQVGDEREAYEREYQAELKRSGGTLYAAVFARNNDKYVIGHVQTGWWAWSHRAALAPAAIVMPERRTDANYPVQLWREAAGWNAALDEVARLNRRAIPEGLLERIAKMPSSPEAEMDRYEACDELRSLLSQQQEGGV